MIGIGEIKKAKPKLKKSISETPRQLHKNRTGNTIHQIPTLQDYEQKTAELINESFQTPDENEKEGQLSIDVYQTKQEIVIIAPVAGVPAEELYITVDEDILSIKGRRKTDVIPEKLYCTKECFWGKFSRSIILPENTDKSKIKATFKNAILKITIPKTELVRTRIVKIREET